MTGLKQSHTETVPRAEWCKPEQTSFYANDSSSRLLTRPSLVLFAVILTADLRGDSSEFRHTGTIDHKPVTAASAGWGPEQRAGVACHFLPRLVPESKRGGSISSPSLSRATWTQPGCVTHPFALSHPVPNLVSWVLRGRISTSAVLMQDVLTVNPDSVNECQLSHDGRGALVAQESQCFGKRSAFLFPVEVFLQLFTNGLDKRFRSAFKRVSCTFKLIFCFCFVSTGFMLQCCRGSNINQELQKRIKEKLDNNWRKKNSKFGKNNVVQQRVCRWQCIIFIIIR